MCSLELHEEREEKDNGLYCFLISADISVLHSICTGSEPSPSVQIFPHPESIIAQSILLHKVLSRAYKRREGMQLGKHQNSNVGGRMCINASCSRFLLIECRQNVADS